MTEKEAVIYTSNDSVGRIELNSPEQGNTLTPEILEKLIHVFEKSAKNRDICVHYTARGSNFCFGADLKYGYRLLEDPQGSVKAMRFYEFFQEVTRAIRRHPGVVIAGLKGNVVGGGFEITLACDLRVATRDTMIMFPELNLGTMFSNGTTNLLPRIIGDGRARELLLLAKSVRAEEALQMGLINEVCEPNDLERTLSHYASEVRQKDAFALGLAKNLINENADSDLESAMKKEVEALEACSVSESFRFRLKNFVESQGTK